MDNWWRIVAIGICCALLCLLVFMGIRYLVHSKRSKNTEQPKQALAIEQAKDSTSTVLEGEIVGVDDPWPDFNGERLDTDELPVFGRYPLDDEPHNEEEPSSTSDSSHRRAHIRFFVEYAAYTCAYLASVAIAVGLSILLWSNSSGNILKLSIALGAGSIVAIGLWPLSTMLQRSDARWDASTTPPPQPGVPYSRQLHISVLAHSILLQAAIWGVAFIVTSWILNALDTALYWHFVTQLIVTIINVYFVVRTLIDWKLRIVTVTATMFKISRPDILILANTGKRSVNEERRTLIGFAIDQRTLTERFAYRTRGTIIIKSQETQNGDTAIQKFPYISNVEALKAALESPSESH